MTESYHHNDTMSSYEAAPIPKRQKSSARNSVHSLRIEKPLSSQTSPKYNNHRRRTTPAPTQRQTHSKRNSATAAPSAVPMAPPSCIFPFRSFEYKRPSTWHYNSERRNGKAEGSSNIPNRINPAQATSTSYDASNTMYNVPMQWPSQAVALRSKTHQSAPPSGRLLFNEIPQTATWFNSDPYQAEDNTVSNEPTSFFFDTGSFDNYGNQSFSTQVFEMELATAHNADFTGFQPLPQPAHQSIDRHQQPAHSQQPDFNMQPSLQDLATTNSGVEQDLIGLGLYDKPTSPATNTSTQHTLFSEMQSLPLATTTSTNKPLKLTETWQPLSKQTLDAPDAVPEAEEDDGASSPADEVEVPHPTPFFFSQPPLLMQEPEKMNMQENSGVGVGMDMGMGMGMATGLGGRSFLFDDEGDTGFDPSGMSWFGDTGCVSQMPFEAAQMQSWGWNNAGDFGGGW